MSNRIAIQFETKAFTQNSQKAVISAITKATQLFLIENFRQNPPSKERLNRFNELPNDTYRIRSIGGVSVSICSPTSFSGANVFSAAINMCDHKGHKRALTVQTMLEAESKAISFHLSVGNDNDGFGKKLLSAISKLHSCKLTKTTSDEVEELHNAEKDKYLVCLGCDTNETKEVALTKIERACIESIFISLGKGIESAFIHERKYSTEDSSEQFVCYDSSTFKTTTVSIKAK